jgi:hypothetical protein
LTVASTGYILTYKAAGDPTTTTSDATQVGRLAIQSIDASGAKTLIYDDNTVGGGWTSARFVTVWDTATVNIGGITCKADPNVWYFSGRDACATPGVDDCVTVPDGSNRVRSQPDVGNTDDYSDSCGAGGWRASSVEMLRFMAGVQYAKVLSMPFNDQPMDMSLTAPNGRTAMGWGTGQQPDDPWAGPGADQMTLDKGGERGSAETSFGTLPDQAAYVVMINSAGGNKRTLIKEAYQYGIGADASCTDLW